MTLVVLIALAVLVAVVVGLLAPSSPRLSVEEELGQKVIQADAQIQAEYRAARRAMNDAAGQSWRNLID